MKIIGRKLECELLDEISQSMHPEFLVVYGRRRIGKTYLISEHFGNSFAFRTAGLSTGTMVQQLEAFADDLYRHGSKHSGRPKSWIEAFSWLQELLEGAEVTREQKSGKRIVFIDEMPWFDTPRSGFKAALEHFWNVWASTQEDLLLVACGSSTSWIVNELLSNTGGFYNRVTRIMALQPFDIQKCKEFLEWKGVSYSARQLVECYMIFGGVPYYLDLQRSGKSLAQNIEALMFQRNGQLVAEFDRLYQTLFRNPASYMNVVRTLATKKSGMLRSELAQVVHLQGNSLTKVLSDLELCGFVRGYRDFTKRTKSKIYQLTDPFTLFYFAFIEDGQLDSWLSYIGTPSYYAWAGLSFEMVCLAHIDQIKRDLGIAGVQTTACAWRSKKSTPGAQIDLLIDRRDDVINLFEVKYTDGEYAMTSADEQAIRNKLGAFREEVNTKKAVHPVLVTLGGAKHNEHYNAVILGEVCVADWIGEG